MGRRGRTKGWDGGSGSGSLEGIFCVEGGLGFEHGTGDGEEAVGDAAQGAAMAMTALAQFGIAGAAARVVLNGVIVDSSRNPTLRTSAVGQGLGFATAAYFAWRSRRWLG